MSRKEEDAINYKKKIKRNPNQKIIIRKEIIESAERSKKFETNSNKTIGSKRVTEAVQKISDGGPTPATVCEKETIDQSCNAYKNDEASAAMTLPDLHQQQDQPQEEPLDLSNDKTSLRKIHKPKEPPILENCKSDKRFLKKNIMISSYIGKTLRAFQTCISTGSTFKAHKLRFSYDARSKTNPYPVNIPSRMHITGIGLVPGIFVPGLPSKIYKGDGCLEISLTDPTQGKEQDCPFLHSALTKSTTGIDYGGYQHLALSATASSQVFALPGPNGSHLDIPSAFLDRGQPIKPLTQSNCSKRTSEISQLSTHNKPFTLFAPDGGQPSRPLTPDGHQPNIIDIAAQISRCKEPLSVERSEQSSIFHTEEESQGSENMDTGSTVCLPNTPCLYDNVN